MQYLSSAYLRNKRRNAYVDALREEYIAWIVHFFGLLDMRDLPKVKQMTMLDVETMMKLYLRKKAADDIQKQKQEERRQKELLDKLKMTQR